MRANICFTFKAYTIVCETFERDQKVIPEQPGLNAELAVTRVRTFLVTDVPKVTVISDPIKHGVELA